MQENSEQHWFAFALCMTSLTASCALCLIGYSLLLWIHVCE